MRNRNFRWRAYVQRTGSWTLRVVLIVSLLLPSFGNFRAVVAQEAAPANANTSFSLAYVPRDAVAVVGIRPSVLLKRPILAPLQKALTEDTDGTFRIGIQLDSLVETTLILLPMKQTLTEAIIFRTDSPAAAQKFIASFGKTAKTSTYGETTYHRAGRMAYFQPDPRTVVMSSQEQSVIRCIAAGPKGASTTNWAAKWSAGGNRDAVAIINTSLLRGGPALPLAEALAELARGRNRNSRQSELAAMQLLPLWQRSENVFAELRVSNEIILQLVSQSASEEEAQQVQSALLTAIAYVRLIISNGRLEVAARPDEATPLLMKQLDLVDEILEQARVVRSGVQVGFVAHADAKVAKQFVAAATPLVVSTQRVSYRSHSMTNLKQIALAFHNYHDTYKRFPAAVQIGPKNIPHSWRVTILQFIEQSALYDAYRQDEPWDSENNKQVLAMMPDIYRCPLDAADSTNTSYFVLHGPESVFEENIAGRFANILDGTSNTLLAVETRKPVPWTKPQELPFDPEGVLPMLGGWYPDGFCAAMCDGRTLFVPNEYDRLNLRRLITRADGNPVVLPDARR